jgi:hypothetical protein
VRGSDGRAVNLRVTLEVQQALRAAFLRHGGSRGAIGPLLGYKCLRLRDNPKPQCRRFHMYYARYRGVEWALATFWSPFTGDTDQPERFKRQVRGRWRDLGDTGGPLSQAGIPCPVLRVWAISCSS